MLKALDRSPLTKTLIPLGCANTDKIRIMAGSICRIISAIVLGGVPPQLATHSFKVDSYSLKLEEMVMLLRNSLTSTPFCCKNKSVKYVKDN